MVAKWILLFVFASTCSGAFSQFYQESHSRIPLEGIGLLTGTSHSNRLSRTCGIYSTPDDRQSGKLSVAIDCTSEDHSIKSGFIRDKSAIRIVREEKTYKYRNEDLYGYRDCRGNEYHFFDGKRYQLLNPGESIPVYRVFEWRGKQHLPKYFFTGKSPGIKPLTLENLRIEFSGEPLFLQKLDVLARNDFQLVRHLHAINRVRMNTMQNIEPDAEGTF